MNPGQNRWSAGRAPGQASASQRQPTGQSCCFRTETANEAAGPNPFADATKPGGNRSSRAGSGQAAASAGVQPTMSQLLLAVPGQKNRTSGPQPVSLATKAGRSCGSPARARCLPPLLKDQPTDALRRNLADRRSGKFSRRLLTAVLTLGPQPPVIRRRPHAARHKNRDESEGRDSIDCRNRPRWKCSTRNFVSHSLRSFIWHDYLVVGLVERGTHRTGTAEGLPATPLLHLSLFPASAFSPHNASRQPHLRICHLPDYCLQEKHLARWTP